MNDLLMCRWLMKTENAMSLGAQSEVFKQGMLKASFSEQNKLVVLDLTFDVMGFMQQLPRATGQDFEVVPNTLSMARHGSVSEARIIASAIPPFRIESVNQSWTELCGFSKDEAQGKTLALLQGAETDDSDLQRVLLDLRRGWCAFCIVKHYAKDATHPFTNFLRLFPLASDGSNKMTHFMGIFESIAGEGNGMSTPKLDSPSQRLPSTTWHPESQRHVNDSSISTNDADANANLASGIRPSGRDEAAASKLPTGHSRAPSSAAGLSGVSELQGSVTSNTTNSLRT